MSISRRDLLTTSAAAAGVAATPAEAAFFTPDLVLTAQPPGEEVGYIYGATAPQPVSLPHGPGEVGPAPFSMVFGSLPDRLNMLRPTKPSVLVAPFGQYMGPFACNFLNQWLIFNLNDDGSGPNTPLGSLGGFTTAPDGTTNTAQLFVEAAINNQHQIWCGCVENAIGGFPPLRLSGYFKSSNRRVELVLGEGGQLDVLGSHLWFLGTGVKCVFDLVNGQIGVAPVKFGSGGASIIGAEIVPVGNGWYKCSIDANGFGGSTWGIVITDNGTGVNAESITYAGDGVSGVYGWRTNLMPIQAYAMNSVCFFDDFNDPTLANVDKLNSKAPGFDWYIDHATPTIPYLAPGQGVSDMTGISASGSILTQLAGHNLANTAGICTAVALSRTAPTTYIGHTWVPPALFESRFAYNFPVTGLNLDTGAFWTWSLDYNCNNPFSIAGAVINGPQNFNIVGCEIDFFEDFRSVTGAFRSGAGSALSYEQALVDIGGTCNKNTTNGTARMSVGAPPWDAVHPFNPGDSCFYIPNSTFYVAINAQSINKPPPSNPGLWAVYSAVQPISIDDPTLMHVYSCLMLPHRGSSNAGCVMQFYDGVYAGNNVSASWRPTSDKTFDAPSDTYQSSDNHHFPIMINAGNFTTYQFDWVRVTQ